MLKQRVGFKSAMLADVRPLTDGRVNYPTFNFSVLCLFIIAIARGKITSYEGVFKH